MNEKDPNQYNFEKKENMLCSFCGRSKDTEEVKKMLTNDEKNLNICEICVSRCNYLLKIHRHKNKKVISFDYQSKFPELASDCFDSCEGKECIKGKCLKEKDENNTYENNT